jgi:hypothetical protein
MRWTILALLTLGVLAGAGCGSASSAVPDAAVAAPDAPLPPDADTSEPSSSLMGTSGGGGSTGTAGGMQLVIGVGQPVMGATDSVEAGVISPAQIE